MVEVFSPRFDWQPAMPASDSENQRDPSQVMYRGCLTASGAGLLMLGLGLVGYGLFQLVTVGASAATVGALIVVSLMALGGAGLLVLARKAAPATTDDADLLAGSRQRGVLQIARKYDGRVTLAEITLETSLEMAEARAILDDFQVHGVADLQVSDSGQQVYVFAAFTDNGRDKLTAQSPLDEDAEVELLFEQLEQADEDAPAAAQAPHHTD